MVTKTWIKIYIRHYQIVCRNNKMFKLYNNYIIIIYLIKNVFLSETQYTIYNTTRYLATYLTLILSYLIS